MTRRRVRLDTSGRDREIVVCRSCERPYVARIGEAGGIILPVGGSCACGGESFDRVEGADVGSDRAARASDD
jgi:hypothetical protein